MLNSSPILVRIASTVMVATIVVGPIRSSFGQVNVSSAETQAYQGRRIPYELPDAISVGEMDAYALLIGLAGPQRNYVDIWYADYRASAETIITTARPQMDLLSIDGGKAESANQWNYGAIYRQRLAEGIRGARERLRTLDDDFFGRISSILGDSQIPALDRVRLRRARSRSSVRDATCGAAHIDLSRFLTQLFGSTAPVDGAEPTLNQYEMELTPLVVRLGEVLPKSMVDFTAATAKLSEAYANKSPEKAALIAAAQKEREDALRAAARLQRQIVDLNDRTVIILSKSLEQEMGKQLLDAYRQSLYSEVFPDSINANDIAGEIVQAPGLAGKRETLASELRSFHDSWESVSLKMQTACNVWQEEFAATYGSATDDTYRKSMRTLRSDRWKLDVNLVESLLAQLPEQEVALRAKIEAWLARSRAIVRTAESDNDYPFHVPHAPASGATTAPAKK